MAVANRTLLPERAPTETVLVVEDEDAVRKATIRMLRNAGYQVLAASNGGEALLLCEGHPGDVDLLITDVVMPNLGGRDLVERLVKICPRLKVLYMSGYTDGGISQQDGSISGARFIGKPFSASELERRVRHALDEGPISVRVR